MQRLTQLLTIFFFINVTAVHGDTLFIGNFSSKSLKNWKSKQFSGQTNYQLVLKKDLRVLKAQSHASASGLYKEQRVDLRKTPYLNWSWQVENTLENLNEQSKEGDDYVARVYVVVSGGLAFWKTRAINYVWASSSAKGQIWENAFVGKNAMMIALRSKEANSGQWYNEKRNILDDLKQQFGEDIRYIDAVAIMTDTDNSGGNATAFYSDIYFSD